MVPIDELQMKFVCRRRRTRGVQYALRTLDFMHAASLLTPRQAAEKLGISYPALKHWILAGRIRTVKTPGGHHRVPVDALDEFLPPAAAHPGSARISGRNQLSGTVLEVTIDGLLAKVVLGVGKQRITAIITSDAVRELALKPGEPAVALIKATEVMIGKP
jgi:molybdopterin-binding protein